jgi:hypothetical protein
MRKFGIVVAGLALLTATTDCCADARTEARMKAMARKMKVVDIPVKSTGVFISAGTMRVKNGVLTSDKPIYAISRKPLTVLPSGGVKISE